MSHELNADIVAMIEQDFPVDQQANAIRWIASECNRSLPLCEKASDAEIRRIQAAVVNLSKGDISQLRYWIDVAKKGLARRADRKLISRNYQPNCRYGSSPSTAASTYNSFAAPLAVAGAENRESSVVVPRTPILASRRLSRTLECR